MNETIRGSFEEEMLNKGNCVLDTLKDSLSLKIKLQNLEACKEYGGVTHDYKCEMRKKLNRCWIKRKKMNN